MKKKDLSRASFCYQMKIEDKQFLKAYSYWHETSIIKIMDDMMQSFKDSVGSQDIKMPPKKR